jgi:hypothetical protein
LTYGRTVLRKSLEAVGDPDPNAGSSTSKRMRLALRIREAAARAGSGVVLLFCDEAQRYNDNEYEWLRDVHDPLDRQQIKLFTFLVGSADEGDSALTKVFLAVYPEASRVMSHRLSPSTAAAIYIFNAPQITL